MANHVLSSGCKNHRLVRTSDTKSSESPDRLEPRRYMSITQIRVIIYHMCAYTQLPSHYTRAHSQHRTHLSDPSTFNERKYLDQTVGATVETPLRRLASSPSWTGIEEGVRDPTTPRRDSTAPPIAIVDDLRPDHRRWGDENPFPIERLIPMM